MSVQLATVTVTEDMPRWWRVRANDLQRGGIGIRLPDYAPMGCKRHHIALTALVMRARPRQA